MQTRFTLWMAALALYSHTASAQDISVRPIQMISEPSKAADLSLPMITPIAVPTAVTNNPNSMPLAIEQIWTLTAGVTVEENLRTWAEKAQWHVEWHLPHSWVVPNTSSFTGTFDVAAEKVINTLAKNGALLSMGIFEDNKTIVIGSPGSAQHSQPLQ